MRVLKEFKLAAHIHNFCVCSTINHTHTFKIIAHSVAYRHYIQPACHTKNVCERASELNETRFAIEAMLVVAVVVVIIVGPFAQPTWLLRVILFVPTINIFFKCFFLSFWVCYTALNCVYESSFLPVHCVLIRSRMRMLTAHCRDILLVVMVLIVLCNCYVTSTSSILFNLTIFLLSLSLHHSTASFSESAKFFDDVQNVATPNWIFHHFCSN